MAKPTRGKVDVWLVLMGLAGAVMVPLVIGVCRGPSSHSRREETIAGQNRLLAAIAAYRKITGERPPDRDPPGSPYDSAKSMDVLLACLQGNRAQSAATGREIADATAPFLGEDADILATDAWGRRMRYYADRGLGGRPLILSAGPDGEFGEDNEAKRKDNIRSDSRR